MIGMVSAKGSPGVTTTAAALVAVADGEGLLVELDPSGGSVGSWCGGSGEAGLLALASRLRRAQAEALWPDVVAEPLSGVPTVVAPTAEPQARAAVEMASDRIGLVARSQLDRAVAVLDGGRWTPGQRSATRVTGCDAVALVCHSTVEGLEAARWMLDPLALVAGVPVVLVLIGVGPYGAEEVAGTLGAPVAATIAWDPAGAAMLRAHGATTRWRRSQLARSAGAALDSLGAFAIPWRAAVGDG